MRLTRAYIAGLGTTGSLLAAAACTLLFTSAVVAFKGTLPTPSIGPTSGSISVPGPSVAFDRPGTQIVAARAAGAAAAVAPTSVIRAAGTVPAGVPTSSAGRPLTGTRVLLNGNSAGIGGVRPSQTVASATPTTSAPASGASSAPAPSGDGSPVLNSRGTLAGTVEQTTSTISGTIQSATHAAGPPAGQVSPPAGQAVITTGQAVSGAIGDVGHTGAGTLRGAGG